MSFESQPFGYGLDLAPSVDLRSEQEVMVEFVTLVNRVRAEFIEMPGLRLTVRQATRLLGIEQALCQSVVDALVASAFLRHAPGGTFVRAQS